MEYWYLKWWDQKIDAFVYPYWEGRRHTIFQRGRLKREIPRHTEGVDELAKKICKDPDIPFSK